MWCFSVLKSQIGGRFDPGYIFQHRTYSQIKSKYRFANLGSLLAMPPQYGANEVAIDGNPGSDYRYIRITDIDEFGNLRSDEWKTAQNIEEKYLLEEDDVLFARSGATAGKTYIHKPKDGNAIFAGYLIRFRFNRQKIDPLFVFFYTQTNRYSKWVSLIQRPSGQPNINSEEFKALEIPVPDKKTQGQVIALMNQAYAEKQRLEQKADELLASINGYILENLGIKSPQDKRKAIFSINSSDVKGQRLDPHFYSIKSPDLEEIVPLDSLVTFSKETWDQKSIYADYFPYIEISEIETISGQINNVSWLPKDKAPSRAKMIVRAGDIIVSTTRPHRGAIARITAEYDQYIASTGFAIIRTIKKKSLLKDFLFYVLRTNFVLNQMIQRSTGGNYPAITLQELKKVQVPVANIKTQQSIIKEVQSCVNKAADLKKQALFTINKAKADVENILFGEEA